MTAAQLTLQQRLLVPLHVVCLPGPFFCYLAVALQKFCSNFISCLEHHLFVQVSLLSHHPGSRLNLTVFASSLSSCPQDTGFFRGWGGAWDSSYGRFFMTWYSDQLLLHGERLCKIASCIFNTSRPPRCTPRYHSTHPSSPLNPMSLVSNLASVIRCPHQHPAHAPQQLKRAPTEPQCVPLHQPSTAQGRGLATGDASISNPPNEPLTPGSAFAPKPCSWPDAYQAAAQDANEAIQVQQFSSLQPSTLPQPSLADMTQLASDSNSHSAASHSSSEGGIAASQILVSNEDKSDVASSSKHCEASSVGQVDSLPYVPLEVPTASSTDEPEAPSAKPAPDRCVRCPALQLAAVWMLPIVYSSIACALHNMQRCGHTCHDSAFRAESPA